MFVLVALFVAVALGQTKPVWPTAASSSIFTHGWERREDRHYMRYFFDQMIGKERIEGPRVHRGELYWTTTILDTTTKREYFIVHQESLLECYERASNYTIPKPNFANARYVGKAEIDNEVVDHWIERSPSGRDHLQIFDHVSSGMIRRMDFDDERRGHAVTFQFHEWNAGAQDPNLFVVPAEILPICNSG